MNSVFYVPSSPWVSLVVTYNNKTICLILCRGPACHKNNSNPSWHWQDLWRRLMIPGTKMLAADPICNYISFSIFVWVQTDEGIILLNQINQHWAAPNVIQLLLSTFWCTFWKDVTHRSVYAYFLCQGCQNNNNHILISTNKGPFLAHWLGIDWHFANENCYIQITVQLAQRSASSKYLLKVQF